MGAGGSFLYIYPLCYMLFLAVAAFIVYRDWFFEFGVMMHVFIAWAFCVYCWGSGVYTFGCE